MRKGWLIPVLALSSWVIFWFYLIQVGERTQHGSPLPVLSEASSGSALRVPEAGESGGEEMLEQQLIPLVEQTPIVENVVEDSEDPQQNPQGQEELPEPSEE